MIDMNEDGNTRPVDARSRRIAIVCHCLLNANSKVEGLAVYAGIHPLIAEFASRGIGVIQMQCPEMGACGMQRPGRTREQYEYPEFIQYCSHLADETLAQVREYQRCDYEFVGLVGVAGSPSCGVSQPGVHISALQNRLEPLGMCFAEIDEDAEGHRVDEVLRALAVDA
jgi:predicted secreted protein